jgi:hypothetical protein
LRSFTTQKTLGSFLTLGKPVPVFPKQGFACRPLTLPFELKPERAQDINCSRLVCECRLAFLALEKPNSNHQGI